MRCFSRLTASCGRRMRAKTDLVPTLATRPVGTVRRAGAALAALVLVVAVPGASEVSPEVERRVQAAVADEVRARLGGEAEVQVAITQIRLTKSVANDELVAQPPPGARLTRPIRFALRRKPDVAGGRMAERVGYVVAEVRAAAPHARAARDLARGTVLTDADVMESDGDIGAVRMQALPTLLETIGARVGREVRAGELLSSTIVRLPALVRRGSAVMTYVRLGGVAVTGEATAMQTGHLGDVIALVNEATGRRLRGRVVARDAVEVVR